MVYFFSGVILVSPAVAVKKRIFGFQVSENERNCFSSSDLVCTKEFVVSKMFTVR